jgi:hypothetical protein
VNLISQHKSLSEPHKPTYLSEPTHQSQIHIKIRPPYKKITFDSWLPFSLFLMMIMMILEFSKERVLILMMMKMSTPKVSPLSLFLNLSVVSSDYPKNMVTPRQTLS